MLLQFIAVCGHSFICSFKVLPQHFSQGEIWTLTGPLQHLDSFVFQPFCCRFVAVASIIVLLHDTIWMKLYLSDSWPHIWLNNTFVYRGVHGRPSDCKVPKSCGCKTNPHHHPPPLCLTVGMTCLCWYVVFCHGYFQNSLICPCLPKGHYFRNLLVCFDATCTWTVFYVIY